MHRRPADNERSVGIDENPCVGIRLQFLVQKYLFDDGLPYFVPQLFEIWTIFLVLACNNCNTVDATGFAVAIFDPDLSFAVRREICQYFLESRRGKSP